MVEFGGVGPLLQAGKGDGSRDPVTGGGRKPRVWRGSHRAHMALGTGLGGGFWERGKGEVGMRQSMIPNPVGSCPVAPGGQQGHALGQHLPASSLFPKDLSAGALQKPMFLFHVHEVPEWLQPELDPLEWE